MITIDGHPTHHANRFDVNLVIGDSITHNNDRSDITFHFNPRFHEHYVVRNSRRNMVWGEEEWAPKRNPFVKGQRFSMMILVEMTGYKVAVNNVHFVEFRHRLPLELACLLNITGDVVVERITYHSASSVVSGFVPFPNPPVQQVMPPAPVFSHSMGVPSMQSGPVFGSPAAPQIIHNPVLPFVYKIPGGLRPGFRIKVIGQPSIGFNRFDVDLCKSMTNEIALQVNPRNMERAVVRNSKSMMQGWGHEERTTPIFPFMYGSIFNLTIRVEHNRYVILVNDQYFCDYHHRIQPLHSIDLLKIQGDVNVNSIHLSQE